MKHRAVVVAGLLAGAAALGTGSVASAAPPSVPLENAAGQTNGCTATGSLGLETSGGKRVLAARGSLTCPSSAGVHRVSDLVGWDLIEPDGTVRVISPLSEAGRAASSEPIETGGFGSFLPCTSTDTTHQYRVRIMFKTKQTTDWRDADPYVGTFVVKRRLACTV